MTATLAAAPSQPLWGLPLHGVPCGACGLPAAGMNVYPTGRLIYHHGAPPCGLPNPPCDTPDYQDAT